MLFIIQFLSDGNKPCYLYKYISYYLATLPSGSGVRQTYTTTEYVTTSPTYVTGQTYTTSTPVYTTGATYTTGAQHSYVNSGLAQGYSSYYPTVPAGYSANLTVGATGQKVVAE